MLKICRTQRRLTLLEHRPIPEARLQERADLQQMIRNSPEAFFAEMGESLLLIGEAIRPARDAVEDEIDLLAIDKSGASVLIELKRDRDKLQLLQAIAYAGMIARWPQERLAEEYGRFANLSPEAAGEAIEEFIEEDVSELNQVQRVVLIAQDFDFEVLVAAEWLTERYEVDIRCYRMTLSADGPAEFLSCTCIYPPPELAKAAIRRGRIGQPRAAPWTNWETALAGIENQDLVAYFKQQAADGREQNINDRCLIFRLGSKRRLFVSARQKYAYVWQAGRFEGDESFWETRLGAGCDATPVNGGNGLRFYLETAQQFSAFHEAATAVLAGTNFTDALKSVGPGSENGSNGRV